MCEMRNKRSFMTKTEKIVSVTYIFLRKIMLQWIEEVLYQRKHIWDLEVSENERYARNKVVNTLESQQ